MRSNWLGLFVESCSTLLNESLSYPIKLIQFDRERLYRVKERDEMTSADEIEQRGYLTARTLTDMAATP